MTALIISQIITWIALIGLSIVVFALARQIGVLHERVAPAGALAMNEKLKAGDKAPGLELQTINNEPISLGGSASTSTLVFFLSPDCPVCKTLLPALKSAFQAESNWVRGVLASDGGSLSQHNNFIASHGLGDLPYIVSEDLGRTFGVSKLPYAVLIDETGVIRSLGMVNSREHLDSLFNAKQLGVASIQEFLQRRSQS